jgi:hypothetical protein
MGWFKGERALLVALGASISAVFADPAQATDYHITHAVVPSVPGALIANIYYPGIGGSGSEDVRIGRVQLTGTDEGGNFASLATYCADIFDVLQPGTFSTADISVAPFSAARLAAATTFLAHADPLVTNSTSSAAAQLGLWEILYETGGNWDVRAGAFHSDVANSAANLANSWLADLASHDWLPDPTIGLQLLVPQRGNQLQFQLVAGNPQGLPDVPEPASWTMMLGGFGLIGAMLRGRRFRVDEGKVAV